MTKLGGSCTICGLAQFERKDKCTHSRQQCPYGAFDGPTQMRLAEMLRLYIAAKGLQQKHLAVAMGVGESTLSRFLSGASDPDTAGFAAILTWCIARGESS